MEALFRFVIGLAVGSFINVVALRYDPDRPLFSNGVIGGRSRCPHCRRNLRSYELIPLLSFILLRGKCRTCHKALSWRYPLVELATGLLFILPIPLPAGLFAEPNVRIALTVLWLAVLTVLFLMSLIDMKHQIIPDEVHGILAVLAVPWILLTRPFFSMGSESFISRYALIFGLRDNIWVNHLAAALFAALFFGLLVLGTRGRGMGVGDLKLGAALGFLFGFPDIVFVIGFAFLSGALFGLWKIFRHRGELKTAVPFGPFLALGSLLLILWGNELLSAYFRLFGLNLL